MALLHGPAWGGWGPPCKQRQIRITLDFGPGGKWNVPWEARATRPLLRVAGRIKALNIQHVDGSFPIPNRAAGIKGVYIIKQFGTYDCRPITGGGPGEWSNHAWPLATDVNWATNPYHGSVNSWGPHDMPPYVIAAYKAEGFTWLAQFDPMHFERLQVDAQIEPPGGTGPTTIDYTQFLQAGGGDKDLTEEETQALINKNLTVTSLADAETQAGRFKAQADYWAGRTKRGPGQNPAYYTEYDILVKRHGPITP